MIAIEALAGVLKEQNLKNAQIEIQDNKKLKIAIPLSFYFEGFKEDSLIKTNLLLELKYNEADFYYYKVEAELENGEKVRLQDIIKMANDFDRKDIVEYLFQEETQNMSSNLYEELRRYCYEYKMDKKIEELGYDGFERLLEEEYYGDSEVFIEELIEKLDDDEIKEVIEDMVREGRYDDVIEEKKEGNRDIFYSSLEESGLLDVIKTTESFIEEQNETFLYSKNIYEGSILFKIDEERYNIKNHIGLVNSNYIMNLVMRFKDVESFFDFALHNCSYSSDKEEIDMKKNFFRFFLFAEKTNSKLKYGERTDIRFFFNEEFVLNILDSAPATKISLKASKATKLYVLAISYFINKKGINFLYKKYGENNFDIDNEILISLLRNSKDVYLKTILHRELFFRVERLKEVLTLFQYYPDINFLSFKEMFSLFKETHSVLTYLEEIDNDTYQQLDIIYKNTVLKFPEYIPFLIRNNLIEEIETDKGIKNLLNEKINKKTFFKSIARFGDNIDKKASPLDIRIPKNMSELEELRQYNLFRKILFLKEQKEEIKKIANLNKEKISVSLTRS